ncbi:serine protease [Pelotomaculum terephthalicicum JT]|uniref:S1C family serine protease n=1 Tax=Pelotomaculum TaxID=191373 RepID=UPI0009D0C763|nr:MULTISPECIES: serine protease [Pelotomaculum]MCG9967292.1 serine protease [Pelotomaculum terephthalicicum JT]OPX86431.1 MAG: putative serine protease HhoA precursor [Pelotomaculum sp. PtaB.Bin117]OPY60553.1 MAG: putative serine protease HhoA precursor [Pelotomaculum sp. PtaU1.Bin065]
MDKNDPLLEENLEDGTGSPTEDFEEAPNRRSPLLRLVALITVLAFIGLVVATSWPDQKIPLAELVSKSYQLKNDTSTDLAQAVVLINVLSRSQGASIAVEQKTGTGFNIDPSGVIITNHHVIEDTLNMTITFPDGKVYKAARWSSKPESDLAVIVLEAEGLPAVPVGTTTPPAPGDKIKLVGNPLALNSIMVEGNVGQYLRVKDMQGKIFSIDAPIYPGNSGSPVFNMNGQVVGVVFGSISWQEGGNEKAAGVAVTIDEALALISALHMQ